MDLLSATLELRSAGHHLLSSQDLISFKYPPDVVAGVRAFPRTVVRTADPLTGQNRALTLYRLSEPVWSTHVDPRLQVPLAYRVLNGFPPPRTHPNASGAMLSWRPNPLPVAGLPPWAVQRRPVPGAPVSIFSWYLHLVAAGVIPPAAPLATVPDMVMCPWFLAAVERYSSDFLRSVAFNEVLTALPDRGGAGTRSAHLAAHLPYFAESKLESRATRMSRALRSLEMFTSIELHGTETWRFHSSETTRIRQATAPMLFRSEMIGRRPPPRHLAKAYTAMRTAMGMWWYEVVEALEAIGVDGVRNRVAPKLSERVDVWDDDDAGDDDGAGRSGRLKIFRGRERTVVREWDVDDPDAVDQGIGVEVHWETVVTLGESDARMVVTAACAKLDELGVGEWLPMWCRDWRALSIRFPEFPSPAARNVPQVAGRHVAHRVYRRGTRWLPVAGVHPVDLLSEVELLEVEAQGVAVFRGRRRRNVVKESGASDYRALVRLPRRSVTAEGMFEVFRPDVPNLDGSPAQADRVWITVKALVPVEPKRRTAEQVERVRAAERSRDAALARRASPAPQALSPEIPALREVATGKYAGLAVSGAGELDPRELPDGAHGLLLSDRTVQALRDGTVRSVNWNHGRQSHGKHLWSYMGLVKAVEGGFSVATATATSKSVVWRHCYVFHTPPNADTWREIRDIALAAL